MGFEAYICKILVIKRGWQCGLTLRETICMVDRVDGKSVAVHEIRDGSLRGVLESKKL